MPEYRVLPAGDTALVVEFGERIDRRLSTWVLALAQRLNSARLNGIIETVPTFRSLMVHYDPLALSSAALTARIVELMRGLETAGVATSTCSDSCRAAPVWVTFPPSLRCRAGRLRACGCRPDRSGSRRRSASSIRSRRHPDGTSSAAHRRRCGRGGR